MQPQEKIITFITQGKATAFHMTREEWFTRLFERLGKSKFRTMRKKSSPSFRLAIKYSKLPKYLLYPTFVAAMMLFFWNSFSLIQGIIHSDVVSEHLINAGFLLIGIDVAVKAGKGIYLKLVS